VIPAIVHLFPLFPETNDINEGLLSQYDMIILFSNKSKGNNADGQ